MDTRLEDDLIRQSVDKIQSLAALIRCGDDADLAVQEVVNEIFRYFLVIKKGDLRANLLAFKIRLSALAEHAHGGLPGYGKTLAYAASLVAVP